MHKQNDRCDKRSVCRACPRELSSRNTQPALVQGVLIGASYQDTSVGSLINRASIATCHIHHVFLELTPHGILRTTSIHTPSGKLLSCVITSMALCGRRLYLYQQENQKQKTKSVKMNIAHRIPRAMMPRQYPILPLVTLHVSLSRDSLGKHSVQHTLGNDASSIPNTSCSNYAKP